MPPSPLTERHIALQRRLRDAASGRVTRVWRSLPGYNEENVDQWLSAVLPIVAATQRQSVTLTDVYLARMLRRAPLGIDPEALVGAELRKGTPPEEVYRRPFVTLWGKLGEGMLFAEASAVALERATIGVETDTQLAMRTASNAIERADSGIFGWQRVANPGACEFCASIDGAFVKSADAMDLHNRCNCGLEPLTSPRSGSTKLPETVARHEHGELGPVIGDPAHSFTGPGSLN